jgi:thioredoxin reductase
MADVQVAIIGAGPAGLSAAARALSVGLSHVLIERTDHLCDTIFCYSPGRWITADPAGLELRTDLPFREGKREDLLLSWLDITRRSRARVKLSTELTKLSGSLGDFTLQFPNSTPLTAESVILAIGTQGSPNLLPCEGGDLPHVNYYAEDPITHSPEHIFIIGGGDRAIESALYLSINNYVTLVNRSSNFSKAKDSNVDMLNRATAEGKLKLLTGAMPIKIEPEYITVRTLDGESRAFCQRVIPRLGSFPPRRLLESSGVAFEGKEREALPVVSELFESSVAGLYVVGSLATEPFIKSALNSGFDAIEHIRDRSTALRRLRVDEDVEAGLDMRSLSQRPATIEPVWRNGRLTLQTRPSALGLDHDDVEGALVALASAMERLGCKLEVDQNIDARFVVALKDLARNAPTSSITKADLFSLGRGFEFLSRYVATVEAEWPSVFAAEFHSILLLYDRTLCRFPAWTEFKDGVAGRTADRTQLDSARNLGLAAADALENSEISELIDSRITEELRSLANQQRYADELESGMELLAADLIESVNNILKSIAGVCVAASTSLGSAANGYLHELSAGLADAAKTQGKKDGKRLFVWLHRLVVGVPVAASGAGGAFLLGQLITALPEHFGWLATLIRMME